MTDKLLLTPEEAAEKLTLSRTQIYALMKAKRILSVKIGKARRISVRALKEYVERAENKLVCPNCEWAIETRGNVKFISTLGSDRPRKAFAKCPQCATDIEIGFTEEQD